VAVMALDVWEDYVAPIGTCFACQKQLAEQETYFATLAEVPAGFQRRDYCADCWKDEYRSQAFSFWQAKVPARQEKPKMFVDKQVLSQIFRRLAGTEDENKLPFAFVLTLIMMRKRLVKYLSTEHHDGTELWVVRLTGEDQQYRIANPHLSEEQLEHVREQLNEVLACN